MSKKFIIITSIFDPTEAVKKFAEISDWRLIVVGDKKSPEQWQHDNVTYLSPEDQQSLNFKILEYLPWNHYCRKMVGYLYALSQGAEMIADTDDDNIPYEGWPSLPDPDQQLKTLSGAKFVNVYKHFTDEFIWPRGYPLDRILESETAKESEASNPVGIWQFLADEDPDVDAIYRLTINKLIFFKKHPAVVLEQGTVCPFNSQNTIFSRKLFPLLYLPAFVTFRFTDILRGLVAQPLLWKNEYRLGFGPATVIQKRNPHNYLKDFESEIPVYLKSEQVIDIAVEVLASEPSSDLADQLVSIYLALREKDIVTDDEIKLLRAWVEDLKMVGAA